MQGLVLMRFLFTFTTGLSALQYVQSCVRKLRIKDKSQLLQVQQAGGGRCVIAAGSWTGCFSGRVAFSHAYQLISGDSYFSPSSFAPLVCRSRRMEKAAAGGSGIWLLHPVTGCATLHMFAPFNMPTANCQLLRY